MGLLNQSKTTYKSLEAALIYLVVTLNNFPNIDFSNSDHPYASACKHIHTETLMVPTHKPWWSMFVSVYGYNL